jgi:hypothetical protein
MAASPRVIPSHENPETKIQQKPSIEDFKYFSWTSQSHPEFGDPFSILFLYLVVWTCQHKHDQFSSNSMYKYYVYESILP